MVGTSGWFTYKEGGTSYAAYVTDNTSQKLVMDDTFLGKAPSGAKIRMVIATGDVKVQTDFEATILSKRQSNRFSGKSKHHALQKPEPACKTNRSRYLSKEWKRLSVKRLSDRF